MLESVIIQPMRHIAAIGLSLLFIIFFGTYVFSQDYNLPEGWRIPTPEETYIEEGPFKGNNKYLEANADFNGDERIDTARILMRSDGSGIGLLVFLSLGDSYKTILLDTADGAMSAKNMGVSTVGAGTFKTACAKGYGPPCDKDEPKEVNVPFTAINFFMMESANSYFYWDTQTGSFKRVWISD